MSRPHGHMTGHHSHVSTVSASSTFTNARQSLVHTLENLSFVKVVTIQNTPAGYTGEAVEVHFRDAKDRPKLVFFDKFGRSRSSLTVGPIKVSQAPLGIDHPSAVPTVGEILVGSLVPNARKSHLDHVLRGWSSDATPLKELLRLLKFGTKHSEFEVRQILLQPAALLTRSPASIKKSRDDIYMTARIILWSSLRPLQILCSIEEKWPLKKPATSDEIEMASNIKISCKALDFIEALIVKFNDSKLSEEFFKDIEVPETPEEGTDQPNMAQQPIQQPLSYYVTYGQSVSGDSGLNVGGSSTTYQAMASELPSEEYDPSSTFAAATPPYAPSSPTAAGLRPDSPPYIPTSRPASPGNLYEDL